MSAREASRKRQRRSQTTKTLLVVDDRENQRTLCRMELADEGYRVLTACDAVEAVQVATVWDPQLIVLDPYMRGMEGHRVLEEVKAALPNLRVVIYTGHAGDAFEPHFRSADAYLVKSSDLEPLKKAISEVLASESRLGESRETVLAQ